MHDRRSTQSAPSWVMAIGIMVTALLLLFGSLHLVGRSLLGQALGGHGDHAPPSSTTEHGPQLP